MASTRTQAGRKGRLKRDEAALLSYNSTETRLSRAMETLPDLRQALAALHVEPDFILIRAVRFPVGYEERLQEKQLTYQRKLLATAQRKAMEPSEHARATARASDASGRSSAMPSARSKRSRSP